jgi:hypothetical protein
MTSGIRLVTLTSVIMLAATCAFAQPGEVGAPADHAKTTPVAHVSITPHRAIYDMSLASVKNGSNVAGVSGKMLFEWSDVCDGWAVQQHLTLHFSYSDETVSNITSTELTWESKDGKKYNFNIHRATDNKEDETYRGKATLNADGGIVSYTTPDGKKSTLPADAMFPSAHTQMILQHAAENDHFFTKRVFDGTDEQGSNDVSVFIDAPQAHWLETSGMDATLKTNSLLNQSAWPVRMAFFKVDSETGEPDYEMDLMLLNNGIARQMRIDYGDFSVLGTLTNVEAMPIPHC